MREFLLRGKRTDNGEWVCGYYTKARYFLNKKEMHIIFEPDVEAFPHCEFTGYEEVLPETVGQYTGLTDKNGVRIFEGDIVERVSDGERAVISWLKYSACFGLSFDGWCCGFDNYDDNLPSDFEVIGNIHDNSEILKNPSL